MTEGEKFMTEIPLGDTFYTKIDYGTGDSAAIAGKVVRRVQRWGIRTIDVQLVTGGSYSLQHAANWWGRLRFWLQATELRWRNWWSQRSGTSFGRTS